MCSLLRNNRNNSLGNFEWVRIADERRSVAPMNCNLVQSRLGAHRSNDWDLVAIRFILFR